MPIIFQCSKCGKRFRVRDELAGRRARCKCGGEIAIPSSATEPQPRPKPRPQPRPQPRPRAQAKPQPRAQPRPQPKPRPKPQPKPPMEEELELEVLPELEPEPAASGLAGLFEDELVAGESLGPALPALPAQSLQQPAAPQYRPPHGPRPDYPAYSAESGEYRPGLGSRRRRGPREEASKFYLRILVAGGGALFGLVFGILHATEFFGALEGGNPLRAVGLEGGGFFHFWETTAHFLLMVGCFGLVAVGVAIILRVPSATQFGVLAGGTVVGVVLLNLVVLLIGLLWLKAKLDLPGFPTEWYFGRCVKALIVCIVPGAVVWWCGSPMGQDLGR